MSETGSGVRQIDLFELLPAVESAPSSAGPLPVSNSQVAPPPISEPTEDGAEIGPANASVSPRLSDGKEPDAFRTIGEVAQALGIRPHVLRYWEEQFPMLRPVKRSGARRYYRPEDIALVETIDRLVHREGYTLRGARQLLEAEARQARQSARSKQGSPAVPIADGAADVGGDLLGQLRAVRGTLADALKSS